MFLADLCQLLITILYACLVILPPQRLLPKGLSGGHFRQSPPEWTNLELWPDRVGGRSSGCSCPHHRHSQILAPLLDNKGESSHAKSNGKERDVKIPQSKSLDSFKRYLIAIHLSHVSVIDSRGPLIADSSC